MGRVLLLPDGKPRNTLSDASFPNSIAGYSGPRRKTTSMRKTFGILDPLAFGRQLPLTSTAKPEQQQPDRKLYRASYLEGFVEAEATGFVEFTANGPKVFTMGTDGPEPLYPHNFSENLFVELSHKLAALYAQDLFLSRRICSMLFATTNRPPANFLKTSIGFREDYHGFFIALSDLASFYPAMRLSMRRASFTQIPDSNDAYNLHWEGRAIFSSQSRFEVGKESYLYAGFDGSAVSYYLGSGENISNYRSLYFVVSHDARLYLG